MLMMRYFLFFLGLLFFGTSLVQSAVADESSRNAGELKQESAVIRTDAVREMMLGVDRAGKRIVAVGDRGVILISDDEGTTFRQAASVPTQAMLTSVKFVDDLHGWAVGHWGTIIVTQDGGETWSLQRTDTAIDQPLFSVHFTDAHHGIAAGLWSLVLVTNDAGKHWDVIKLTKPPEGGKADRNLFALLSDAKGNIYIAAERGEVLKSVNHGATWTYLKTGYKGSLWSGMVDSDGTVLVGGLRGSIFRSTDGGKSWSAASVPVKSSITSLANISGMVVAAGLDGIVLLSHDKGKTFIQMQSGELEGKAALNAILACGDGQMLVFSEQGPLKLALPGTHAAQAGMAKP